MCVFCEIIAGRIPSDILFEDETLLIIRDIAPKAKRHYLCIPKEHFALLSELDAARAEAVKHCFETIPAVAERLGLADGYRLVVNQGEHAGQTVPHLHIHMLGGEPLPWD